MSLDQKYLDREFLMLAHAPNLKMGTHNLWLQPQP